VSLKTRKTLVMLPAYKAGLAQHLPVNKGVLHFVKNFLPKTHEPFKQATHETIIHTTKGEIV
jgi:hypothetical protein